MKIRELKAGDKIVLMVSGISDVLGSRQLVALRLVSIYGKQTELVTPPATVLVQDADATIEVPS